MKTVFVKYKVWRDSSSPLLDGGYVYLRKVVKVSDLLELNEMFDNIEEIEILE